MASKTFQTIPAFKSKPHIVVLTDICNEPDDAESLTRFLLYANEFTIDALVATTSTWQRTSTHKQEIHRIINAYSTVEKNLNAHVPPTRQFPCADDLRAIVRSGLDSYGMEAARGPLSEGTELLIQAIDQISTDGCIWVLIWGGANVLAQALLEIQKTRTESEVVLFTSKIRVYAISDQDDAGPWIRFNFPKLFYIASVHAFNMYGLAAWSGISGESYYGFNLGGPDSSLVTKEWLQNNIQIGPYGKIAYPDPVFIPEGDTPTFLSLIQNGLTDPLRPEWGGWGGRYQLTDATGASLHYSDAADAVVGMDGKTHIGNQATIWRWRQAYQDDFAARMQWTLSSDFSSATHSPHVIVNGDSGLEPIQLKATFGSVVELDASETWHSDSTSNFEFKWMHYQEPSATQWSVGFEVPKLQFEDVSASKTFEKVTVKIPAKEEGFVFPLNGKIIPWGKKTYHLILEVVNKGKYPMRGYRRILVEVDDK
ncbi:cellulose-binding protein [Leptodontidium sp. MPI-SDFR-AT-0119]|nr:cellulose-binding protein [Leptodontidium sp. MPI-SDFR-AT-0119]